MRRHKTALVMLLMVPGLIGCGADNEQQLSAGEAFKEMRDTLEGVDDPKVEVAACEEFIQRYPDSEEATNALGAVIYLRSKKLGDLDGALSFAQTARELASDPKTRFEQGIKLHGISVEAGHPVDLREIADELAETRPLNFVEHLAVVEEGQKLDNAWDLVLEHGVAMEELATAETFRNDYPDDDFSDERVEFSVKRRRAWSEAYKGAALTNLGRLEEASAVFEGAADLADLANYVGVPETPLNRYWGKAELLQGRADRATELLAPDALMGGDASAFDDLKAAYLATGGGEDGFESYVASTRQSIATVIDDVTLDNYSGTPVSLASMAGKVFVMAFWNPG